jgi:hypothetical protein
MRTLAFVVAGLALLAVMIAVGRNATRDRSAGTLLAIRLFGIAWFVIAGWNLGEGMRAGHPLARELPIFLVVFGVPAAAAYWATRRA